MVLKALYDTNEDFKKYVDGYAKNYNEGRSITVEVALTHKVVADYAEWLLRRV